MANKNQVTLTFAGDTDKLEKAFSKSTSSAKKFGSEMESASRKTGDALSKAGADARSFGDDVESSSKKGSGGLSNLAKAGVAAAAALAAVAAASAIKFGKALLSTAQDASDLNEALSKSNTVFGTSAKDIESWASGADKALGLSKKGALDAAGSFGNLFSQLGINPTKSAQMSKQIVGLAADFASFHNADISDVLDAQSAAFRGEYDSLQRYLPLINAAAVKQEALALTHKKSEKALTDQDKALAVQSLMMKGAGAAAGDFARTSDGLANSQRIATAEMENMRAEIGERMLPVSMALTKLKLKLAEVLVSKLVPALDKAMKWLKDHEETFKAIGRTLKDKVLPKIQELGSILKEAVKPAVDWLKDHKDLWERIGNAIRDNVGPALDKAAGFLDRISDRQDVITAIGLMIAAVVVPALIVLSTTLAITTGLILLVAAAFYIVAAAVLWVIHFVRDKWDWIKEKTADTWDWISQKTSSTWEGIKNFVSDTFTKIHDKVSEKIAQVKSLFGTIKDALVTAMTGVKDTLVSPFENGFSGIKAAWNRTIGGKGFTTPDWLPFGMGGKSFKIPYLADGGIVNSPTIAMIGEKGPEAVVPLSHSSGPMGGPAVIEIHSGGSDLDRVILEILRRAVRARGGLEVVFR